MTLALNTDQLKRPTRVLSLRSKPAPRPFDLTKEQLTLNFIPIDCPVAIKRTWLYSIMEIVRLNPNISDYNLCAYAIGSLGIESGVVQNCLRILTSDAILPVLQFWTNPRGRKPKAKYYQISGKNKDLFESFRQHLLQEQPSLHALEIPVIQINTKEGR